ncbi:RNA-binding domain-containing protein [Xylariaceae sp. FL0804]|nr:RNA-binding domain-containing protein [Xylariaceae sp. FL0804]
MHSVRRAAVRAACSSSRAIAVPRQQVASFAMQISKANMRPATTLRLTRCFSQTRLAAQEATSGEKPIAEEPIAEEPIAEEPIAEELIAEEPIAEEPVAEETGSSRVAASPTQNCIFVSNMSFDATEDHLREAFSKYGEITSVNIGRDGRGLSRGFAFIDFADHEASQDAIREADRSFWHGRRINVAQRLSAPSSGKRSIGDNPPSKSLYIGNIPYETSDVDLNQMFRKLDNVVDVRVAVDRNTGWPRGFAHADFADVESAQKAQEFLKSATLGGRTLRVDFSTSRPNPYSKSQE